MMYVMLVLMVFFEELLRNKGRGFLFYYLNLLCRSIWELLLYIWSDFLKGGGGGCKFWIINVIFIILWVNEDVLICII